MEKSNKKRTNVNFGDKLFCFLNSKMIIFLHLKLRLKEFFHLIILLARNKSKYTCGLIKSVQISNVFQTWSFIGRIHKAFHRFGALDGYATMHPLSRPI